ncbi:MAG: RecQ family ATP-dependent DNA helicase [Muribaculaceae bacterium]|nr:RecQ family ATP-dependent DNA helicase [Muribaculaceae bacterium]
MTDPYGYYDFSDDYRNDGGDGGDDCCGTLSPQEVLRRHWGYDSFRPMQAEIVHSVLDGRDTIGLLPTGGGKSITFQVPALMLPGLTIVVTPLISLMKDQVDNLAARNIRAAYLHAGMTRAESDYAFERCRQKRVKLLYVAPERLSSERFTAMLRTIETSLIVVDEAHCISQWGYDFRPSYLTIATLRDMLPGVPVLALTASATPAVVDDIALRLGMRNENRFSLTFSRDNISFLVRHTEDKFGKLIDILKATSGSAIVYTRSRRRTAELASQLAANGVQALFYHAGLESHDKAARQDDWQSGQTRVMAATTAFGMGIDKPDVRLVVHYDIPSTLEEYYQEAGRAGRDGQPSVAVLLVSNRDKATLSRRLTKAFPDKDFIRKVYDEICRFLVLPMGEGFGAVFDFKPEIMCVKYRLPERETMSAIGILARSGYFEFVEEMDIEAQMMINLKREQLYGIDLPQLEEDVMNHILRTYGGIFTDLVQINESLIAAACGITPQTVYDILCRWRREHIIAFIPRRRTPYICFTANRVPSASLTFPKEVYEDRRTAMERQLKAMERFAFDDSSCRVAHMLRYFGEEGAGDCGKCDICRSRRPAARTPFDPADFERRLDTFFSMIAPCEWLDTQSLRPHYPRHFDEVASHLRLMVAEGRLRADGIYVAKPTL